MCMTFDWLHVWNINIVIDESHNFVCKYIYFSCVHIVFFDIETANNVKVKLSPFLSATFVDC